MPTKSCRGCGGRSGTGTPAEVAADTGAVIGAVVTAATGGGGACCSATVALGTVVTGGAGATGGATGSWTGRGGDTGCDGNGRDFNASGGGNGRS